MGHWRVHPGHSLSFLRCWSAQKPLLCSFETWKVLPIKIFPPSEPQALRGRKKTPSFSSFWFIKTIFLLVLRWNNLFLASKSSARGLALLRDQLCVTTNRVEAVAPHRVGQKVARKGAPATRRAGRVGRASRARCS